MKVIIPKQPPCEKGEGMWNEIATEKDLEDFLCMFGWFHDSCLCEITDTTMLLIDDCIYWSDCGGLSETDLSSFKGTLICSSKVRWRSADEYIGKNEVYKSI